MGGIIPGTVPRIIPTIFFADVRVVSENGRGLYTRSGRRIAKLPISPRKPAASCKLSSLPSCSHRHPRLQNLELEIPPAPNACPSGLRSWLHVTRTHVPRYVRA